MHTGKTFILIGVVGLAACGGSSTSGSTPNPYLGTLTVTSASNALSCGTIHTVSFVAGGVNVHTVSAAGGDCLQFTNTDMADHQPASLPATACTELDAPAPLAHGASFTTAPLDVSKVCNWQDLLNPPGAGGGGGGGY